ncbi:MAG: transketolase C-terminal domain-containing protein [Azospirillaceae bacterium]|nr:transketolase C-terminal domain-containing protein [Azospirillaceae bacterium]
MRQVAVNMVETLARQDDRVVFIGSDLGPGLLKNMKADMPDRFFMEGVAEQHIIGMAAGMAMEGYIPYINTIATFLTRRCFDQIAIDVCLENLPVRLIASGGGLVYAPLGPTHLAFEDMGLLRTLPNMAIAAPVDAPEMERLMRASLDWKGPLYIRLAKGGDPVVSRAEAGFAIGKAIAMRQGGDVTLIGTGIMTGRALAAAEQLETQGISASVLHMHTVKPLDDAAVLEAAAGTGLIVTVEEHTRIGGLGSAVAELLAETDGAPRLLRLALPDAFPEGYGSQDNLLSLAGLTVDGITGAVTKALEGRK